MKRRAKPKTPREARTFAQMCALRRDSYSTPNGWIMVDENRVSIYNQRPGQFSTGDVEFTKAEFNRLVNWYNTGSARRAK